jgi:hypothetical protein
MAIVPLSLSIMISKFILNEVPKAATSRACLAAPSIMKPLMTRDKLCYEKNPFSINF